MKKHSYMVRPGYRSKEFLIEFGPYSFEEPFASDLRAVFAENDLVPSSKRDLIFSFDVTFDSPSGPFELVNDEWSFVFIFATESQDAIHYVDRILEQSGRFQKQDVNYEDYA